MALFVLDASVSISWCFPGDPTENTPYSRAILNRLATDDSVDASYMQLAQRTHLPLATCDCPLREAAIAEGIEVI
jgi:hypothetical protein